MYIFICFLLERQFNITADRHSATFISAAVCSFHNARTSARHCRESYIGNSFAEFSCFFIVDMIFFKPCRTKYSNAWTNEMKISKSFYKLEPNLNGENKFITAALGSLEINLLFRRNNALCFFHGLMKTKTIPYEMAL